MGLFGIDKWFEEWVREWFGPADYPLLPEPPPKVMEIKGKTDVRNRTSKRPKEKSLD